MARQRVRTHASRWNTFTLKKESDDGAISIRDRTPLRSKKNNLHLTFHRSRHSQRTEEDTMPKHAHLVVVHFRSGESRREQREESLRLQHVPKFCIWIRPTAESYSDFPSTRAPRLASNVSSRKKNLLRVSQRAIMALHSFYERIPLTSGAYPPQASMRLDQTQKHCPETQQSHVFAAEGCGKKKKQPAMNAARVSHGTNSQKASKVNGRGMPRNDGSKWPAK